MDDITALLMEKNRVLAEMAKKVMRKLKEKVENQRFRNIGHREWERKCKVRHREEQALPKELHEGRGLRSCHERVWCQQERGEFMHWR